MYFRNDGACAFKMFYFNLMTDIKNVLNY